MPLVHSNRFNSIPWEKPFSQSQIIAILNSTKHIKNYKKMRIWLGFLLLPLILFTIIFFSSVVIGLSIALGCGFTPNPRSCANMYYYLLAIVVLSTIGLGYLTTKLAPIKGKYLLSGIYNFLFSSMLFLYFQSSKVPLLYAIGFSCLFCLIVCLGSWLFYFKYKKT